MAAPIVYRWDDSNAPVARGERRSLCDILYACLVTGYGSKPAAGWTREYVNVTFDQAVFRNDPVNGYGRYLRVDGAGGANAYTSNVMGYEVMTSVDDGLFPFTASPVIACTSSTATTTARPWILIADNRAFYFICWTSVTAAPNDASDITYSMFFGDIVSRFTDDAYASCLTCGDHSARGALCYAYTPDTTVPSAYYNTYFPRKANGVAAPYIAATIHGGGPCHGHPGTQGLPYSGGAIYLSRPYLNEGTAYTFRGWFPGYYAPCHPMSFGQFAEISVDGKNYLSLRHRAYNISVNSFISLDDWWA